MATWLQENGMEVGGRGRGGRLGEIEGGEESLMVTNPWTPHPTKLGRRTIGSRQIRQI